MKLSSQSPNENGKIKIIKERKYGIHHRWKSTNRKCSLCHETFKSARELSAHVQEKQVQAFMQVSEM